MITNDEFLAHVFANVPGQVFTCSVPGDPSRGRYSFSPDLDPGNNNYFCVSTMNGDRRRLEDFCALACVVVDDVGTKISWEAITSFPWLQSWTLETSPGNFQVGYILEEPVTDPSVANGIVEALCRWFRLSDMAGVNRLVRLPVGMNGKASLPVPFRTSLQQFDPKRRVKAEYLMSFLGASPTPIETHTDPFLPIEKDPVILAMDMKGHPYETTRDLGRYHVQCPWVNTHTAGRDDGAAYIAPAGFKCHHGHCASKTFADFRSFLGLSVGVIDKAKREAELESYLASNGLSVEDQPLEGSSAEAPTLGAGAGAPTPAPARDDWSVRRFHHETEHRPLYKTDPAARKYDRHWLFEDVILADGMWIMAGHGGEGKSRLALALCMAAAAGLPLGGAFRPVNREGVRTLFITQEDDDSEKFHRYTTQWEAMCKDDARWLAAGERLEKNLFMPDFDPIEGLSTENEKRILDMQKRDGIFSLVIWDPLIMFSEAEDDDHGLNSAAGSRATLSRLTQVSKRIAKQGGGRTSVGFMHHLNKNGGLMGSAMLTNLNRVVFGMEKHPYPPPGKNYSILTCLKSNATQLRGLNCTVELRGRDATAHIIDDFAERAPEAPEVEEEEPQQKKERKRRG